MPCIVYKCILSGPNKFVLPINLEIEVLDQEKLKVVIIVFTSSRDLRSINKSLHKILAIIPKCISPNSNISGDYFVPTFLSDKIAIRMKEWFGVLNYELALKLFNQLESIPESGSFTGWAFESIAHHALESTDRFKFCGDLIPIVKTSSSSRASELYFSASPTVQAPDITFTVQSQKHVVLKTKENFLDNINNLKAMYFVLAVVNNPLFNSFIFRLKESEDMVIPIVWIFQMTTGKLHKGLEKGYNLIKLVKKRAETYGCACVQKTVSNQLKSSPKRKRTTLSLLYC